MAQFRSQQSAGDNPTAPHPTAPPPVAIGNGCDNGGYPVPTQHPQQPAGHWGVQQQYPMHAMPAAPAGQSGNPAALSAWGGSAPRTLHAVPRAAFYPPGAPADGSAGAGGN
jgi:hypothetical protein